MAIPTIEEFLNGAPLRYKVSDDGEYAVATYRHNRVPYLDIRPENPNRRKYQPIMSKNEAEIFYLNNAEG